MNRAPAALAGEDPFVAIGRLEHALAEVIQGKKEIIRLALTALLSRGHLLIEDVPGVGKTTLARALARLVGGTFHRVQFTSDLLPSDILGVSVYRPETGVFELKMGPIFANIVLADEVNRAPPRTQSSLLEAMSEGQVSIDDRTYRLEQPFFVIATQNPQEHFGTYPLPESQMDRFLLRTPMGYPRLEDERRVLLLGTEDVLEQLRPCLELGTLTSLQQRVTTVRVDAALVDYLLTVVNETRQASQLALGISPRGARAWFRAAQAAALLSGRDFVTPDDLKGLAHAALVHRLVAAGQQDNPSGSRRESELLLTTILERVPIPR